MLNNIYIQGKEILKEEDELINNLINFNSDDGQIDLLLPYDRPLFQTHEDLTWHHLDFQVVAKNKKLYYKFEEDQTLYSYNNNMSYIKMKKELFLYFKKLLVLLEDHIDEDIVNYLAFNFFNNINKCKYYKCLNWFIALFIYFINSIRRTDLFFNIINYKDFRKYILKSKIKDNEQIKNILIEFKNICHLTYKHYEDLKILLNFVIPEIASGWGRL